MPRNIGMERRDGSERKIQAFSRTHPELSRYLRTASTDEQYCHVARFLGGLGLTGEEPGEIKGIARQERGDILDKGWQASEPVFRAVSRSGTPRNCRVDSNVSLAEITKFKDAHGRTGSLHQWKTLKSYRRAMSGPLVGSDEEGVPLNVGLKFRGTEMHSYSFYANGVHHERIKFRQYLGPLNLSFTSQQGDLFDAALYPLHPNAIGGRVSVLSQTFQQHRFHNLHLHYVPVVPATETGGLVMYFTNDVAAPMYFTGETEMQHAFSMDNVVCGKIWENLTLSVDPHDIALAYSDRSTGNFNLQSQGAVQVRTITDMTPAGGDQEYGLMYVEGEVEFYGDSIDYNVPTRVSQTLTVNYTNTISDWDEGEPLRWTSDPASTQSPYFTLTVSALDDNLLDKMFYGTVVGTSAASDEQTWYTGNDSTPRTFSTGAGFVFTVTQEDAGLGATNTYLISVFSSYEAARLGDSGESTSDQVVSLGQLVNSNTITSTATGTLVFKIWEFSRTI